MAKHKSILVYDGAEGTEWRGTYDAKDKGRIKKEMKEKGYAGYLAGYRLSAEFAYGVLAFFREKPSNLNAELKKRRANGFKAAQWHWL